MLWADLWGHSDSRECRIYGVLHALSNISYLWGHSKECRETCRECKMCGVLHALNNITYLWGHSEDCWTVSGRWIPAESEAPTDCNQTVIRLLWIHWPTAKQKTKAPPGGPRPEIIVWGIVLVSFGVSFEAAANFGKALSASPYSVSVLFEWTQPAAYDKITLWSKTLIVFHAVCIDGSWEKASINLNPYRFNIQSSESKLPWVQPPIVFHWINILCRSWATLWSKAPFIFHPIYKNGRWEAAFINLNSSFAVHTSTW